MASQKEKESKDIEVEAEGKYPKSVSEESFCTAFDGSSTRRIPMSGKSQKQQIPKAVVEVENTERGSTSVESFQTAIDIRSTRALLSVKRNQKQQIPKVLVGVEDTEGELTSVGSFRTAIDCRPTLPPWRRSQKQLIPKAVVGVEDTEGEPSSVESFPTATDAKSTRSTPLKKRSQQQQMPKAVVGVKDTEGGSSSVESIRTAIDMKPKHVTPIKKRSGPVKKADAATSTSFLKTASNIRAKITSAKSLFKKRESTDTIEQSMTDSDTQAYIEELKEIRKMKERIIEEKRNIQSEIYLAETEIDFYQNQIKANNYAINHRKMKVRHMFTGAYF